MKHPSLFYIIAVFCFNFFLSPSLIGAPMEGERFLPTSPNNEKPSFRDPRARTAQIEEAQRERCREATEAYQSESDGEEDDNLSMISMKPLTGDEGITLASMGFLSIAEKQKNTLDSYRNAILQKNPTDPLTIIKENETIKIIKSSTANNYEANEVIAEDFFQCLKNEYGEDIATLVFFDPECFYKGMDQEADCLGAKILNSGLTKSAISNVLDQAEAIKKGPQTGNSCSPNFTISMRE